MRRVIGRENLAPMLALVFGSCASVGLVILRAVWTESPRYGFLIWNLFLAWLPVLFALAASREQRLPGRRSWRTIGLAFAWLLFFPNAPYILTDLTHLSSSFHRHFWVDLVLILCCAFTGLVLGFLSLYIMHTVVARRFGRALGWLFVFGAAGLSSFGVYIGRFLRLNSWDVVVRPGRVYHDLGQWFGSPMLNQRSAGFILLFAAFLFIAYLMLYALTHLGPSRANGEPWPRTSAG